MTVLDFVRYRKNLKGTKIGCREGDCGACAILIGELKRLRSRTDDDFVFDALFNASATRL
jgi:xanthine dehydrogenase iron-sulfur cluster and FAD-binding subunit A